MGIVFTLKPNTHDRFNVENRIILKKFVDEVINPAFEK